MHRLYLWGEKYLYRPEFFEILIAFLLLPISAIYSLVVIFKKFLTKEIDYEIPIVSIGNLTLGGSSKTPLTKALFSEFSPKFKTYIILRGYKRKSKGLIEVCRNGEILTDTKTSGDEAMEYAMSLENANVIVSENREKAIEFAKNSGAKLILLDDGFSKFHIKKLNILVRPTTQPKFPFTLPSGAYRYPRFFYKFADFILNESDIKKEYEIINKKDKMVLITAIAKPWRLDNFKNICIGSEYFSDHYDFSKSELENLVKKYSAEAILMTEKDYAKAKDFNLNISLIKQRLVLNQKLINLVQSYIKQN